MNSKLIGQFKETLLEHQHSKNIQNVRYNENPQIEKCLETLYRIEAKIDVLLMQNRKETSNGF